MSWEETVVSLNVFLWEILSTDEGFSITKRSVFGSRNVCKFKKTVED